MSHAEFHDGRVILHAGDCLDVIDSLEDCSVDSVVTDPPYHLTSIVKRFGGKNAAPAQEGTDSLYARASRGFMGKEWDGGDIAFRAETWAKVLRVLKPGGHLVTFSAPKCSHRMVCAIEDAGFEIRDSFREYYSATMRETAFYDSLSAAQKDAFLALIDQGGAPVELQWVFGSGFPKSHDVSKGIDKAAGKLAHQSVGFSVAGKTGRLGVIQRHELRADHPDYVAYDAKTDAAREWEGWGTALKPAYEPICLARKPLIGTVAANVLAHGVGAINIDACRIGDFVNTTAPGTDRFNAKNHEMGYRPSAYGHDGEPSAERRYTESGSTNFAATPGPRGGSPPGRWPANVVHDGSAEVLAAFPETGLSTGRNSVGRVHQAFTDDARKSQRDDVHEGFGDSGSAARFFASFPQQNGVKSGKGADLANIASAHQRFHYSSKANASDRIGSKHPTVKPVDLMRWLCRLVTPKGGVILDPFAGTGTTGEAALLEGFRAILIEREDEYRADIARRMEHVFSTPADRKTAIAKIKSCPDPT